MRHEPLNEPKVGLLARRKAAGALQHPRSRWRGSTRSSNSRWESLTQDLVNEGSELTVLLLQCVLPHRLQLIASALRIAGQSFKAVRVHRLIVKSHTTLRHRARSEH
jgi:hypothetical protein